MKQVPKAGPASESGTAKTGKLSMAELMSRMEEHGKKQLEEEKKKRQRIEAAKPHGAADHKGNGLQGQFGFGPSGEYDYEDYGEEDFDNEGGPEFNPMLGLMSSQQNMQNGIDSSMIASMMQQLSMNPQAIQNLIDPNDSRQQMIFSGIQNLAE